MRTCSRCGYEGHNRRQCGKLPPLDERKGRAFERKKVGSRDRCGNCSEPGHKRTTCPEPVRSTPVPAPRPPARAARRRQEPAELHLQGLAACRILRTLRPLVEECAGEGRGFLDSLMLSCYLRGMLAADAKWRARIEAWASGDDPVEEIGAKIIDALGYARQEEAAHVG